MLINGVRKNFEGFVQKNLDFWVSSWWKLRKKSNMVRKKENFTFWNKSFSVYEVKRKLGKTNLLIGLKMNVKLTHDSTKFFMYFLPSWLKCEMVQLIRYQTMISLQFAGWAVLIFQYLIEFIPTFCSICTNN